MKKRKVVSIILGALIIILMIIMPFHLKQVCYEHIAHPEWSIGAWNAVQISSALYTFIVSILTIILVLLNTLKKSK